MRKIKPGYRMVLLSVIFSLLLSGCASMIKSSPDPRFYALEAGGKKEPVEKIDIPADTIIGVGPINIPEYQNRPQIVTQNADNIITFAEFDRWGEPLDLAILRLISENLRVIMPNAVIETYPWEGAIPVKYKVIVNVIQLISDLENDMYFAAQWSIIEVKNNKMVLTKKIEFTESITSQDYSGLVKTLSAACFSLSKQIAENAAGIAEKAEEEKEEKEK